MGEKLLKGGSDLAFDAVANDGSFADFLADGNAKLGGSRGVGQGRRWVGDAGRSPQCPQGEMGGVATQACLVNLAEVLSPSESVNFGQRHDKP